RVNLHHPTLQSPVIGISASRNPRGLSSINPIPNRSRAHKVAVDHADIVQEQSCREQQSANPDRDESCKNVGHVKNAGLVRSCLILSSSPPQSAVDPDT